MTDVELLNIDPKGPVQKQVVDSVANWQLPLLVILFVSVIFVAIKIVVHRHESRTLFMQLQTLEKERDKLSAQWSRLKLEKGMSMNQVRVEEKAQEGLGMRIPRASEIRVVREPVSRRSDPVVQGAKVNNKVALND